MSPLPDVRNTSSSLCAHALFEEQARLTPRRIAARYNGRALTYEELNASANRLAHYLHEHGAGPESLVGIHVDRSLEMLIGLLAVHKAGAAYIPLDPSFPEERLRFMLEDSGLRILLTERKLAERLSAGVQRVICLDSLSRPWELERDSNPEPIVGPENLAYVIYTSGSTGKPKGVQIEHHSLVNFLLAMKKEPGFSASDTLLAVTTLSFDIAGLELLLPLVCGGTVEIAPREQALDGRLLSQAIERADATVMQATPATWRLLLDSGWKGKPDLRILCGGEALPRELADQLLPCCAELWNLYGPTETTIWSTACRIDPGDGAIPIGWPIANTRIYILDEQGNRVPDGEIGELCIGGAGVARGYLNRPELTSKKFIDGVYKTGDLASMNADGLLHFHGRVDHQVKIRGFRIELAEVESALLRHPSVRQAVVVAREDRPGEKKLAAYIVADGNPDTSELRTHILATLPDYMAPAQFVQLNSLPLTPNGKVDRNALPAPQITESTEKPGTTLEAELAAIWAEVLGTRDVPLSTGFFELGGDSLLAARMFALIQQRMGRNLPLTTIMEAPTIQKLAAVIESGQASWQPLVLIRDGAGSPPFYVVHGAGSNVVFHHTLGSYLNPAIPFYGLQARGLDGIQEPLQTVEEMAALYVEEIVANQPEGPYYLGGFSMGGIVAFEMAQILRKAGHEVAFLGLLDTNYPVQPSGFRQRRNLFKRRIYPAVERWEHRLDQIRAKGVGGVLRDSLSGWIPLKRKTVRATAIGDDIPDRRAGLPAHLQKLWRANMRAMNNYRPQSYPGRITLFWGAETPGIASDRRLGWSEVAGEGLEVHVVPGTHQTMRMEPHVRILAAKINTCIERAHAQFNCTMALPDVPDSTHETVRRAA